MRLSGGLEACPPGGRLTRLARPKSRAGSTFIRYFPDKKLGGPKQSLASAEKALVEVKAMIEGSKRIDGKVPATTVKKIEKFLKDAVV